MFAKTSLSLSRVSWKTAVYLMSVVSSISQALMVDEGYSHPVSRSGDEYRAISQVTNEGRTKILTLVELQHAGHVSLEMSLNSLLLNGLE